PAVSIRVGFMSPKACGMVVRRRQMRSLWTHHQSPILMMAIRIGNPCIEHQVAHEDINRFINSYKGGPADRHLDLPALQNSQNILKRMVADPKELLSRIFGDQLRQEFIPMHQLPIGWDACWAHYTPFTLPDRKIVIYVR